MKSTKNIREPHFIRIGAPFFFLKFLLGLILLICLSGCVSRTLAPSFVSEAPGFTFLNRKNCKMRITNRAALLFPPRVIHVPPVRWSQKDPLSPNTKDYLGDYLRTRFYYNFYASRQGDMWILQKDALKGFMLPEGRVAVLEMEVTHLRRGNGLFRYVIGYGLGRTDIQIEGRLKESSTGEEIFAFVAREHHEGYSYNGLNPRALSSRYCLKRSMQPIAKRISETMRDVWICMERYATSDFTTAAAFER